MLSLLFPYTSYNFIQPLAKCIAMIDTIDIAEEILKIQSCGTDVVFWQDKYKGPVIPYTNLMLVKEDEEQEEQLFDMKENDAPSFVTVFKTPFIEAAFQYLANTLNLKVIEKIQINILSASEKFITKSTILDTLTLFNEEGHMPVEMLINMLYDLKEENIQLYTKEQYWGSVFGYTFAPISIPTVYDIIVKKYVVSLEYANFDDWG